MNRQDVEKTITEYLKPIFGFALKRCKNIHDAEDLSQETAIRAFRALLVKDDVADLGKFIWTVAHNTLSNYYRDAAKKMVSVSIDEVTELIADPVSEWDIGPEIYRKCNEYSHQSVRYKPTMGRNRIVKLNIISLL